MLAGESKRTALERNARNIFYLRRRVPRIQSRDAPILIPLLCPAQDKDQSIDEYMAADFSADINDAQNLSAGLEFEDAMLVPLTQMEIFAVVAEI